MSFCNMTKETKLTAFWPCRYIKWIEQTYPQGGKESGLTILLETAVMKFTEEKKYYNDSRYIDLWIKFVSVILIQQQSLSHTSVVIIYLCFAVFEL